VIVVLAQLQNHCRSRETCSFGTPDAVVCRAARSASAALAAVGESVGIAERAGAASLLFARASSGFVAEVGVQDNFPSRILLHLN
jgi:hypothetical protein